MNGIIVVDKPAGWTSHDVVAKLRGALRNAENRALSDRERGEPAQPRRKPPKVGHGGTLDPMATGVLPVFVGKATRAAEFLECADKEYIAGIRLGMTTDTQDITGTTLSSRGASVTPEAFESAIRLFQGAQEQVPPMYSAIKIDGKKLYEIARRGGEVPRPARAITIYEIELLGGCGDEFSFKVVCSKGTYIRTLCHDIGRKLGCGGTMSSLRRTRAGSFSVDAARPLEDVLALISSGEPESAMLPTDAVFARYPVITLGEAETLKCMAGASFNAGAADDGTYRFYGPDNGFIALGQVKGAAAQSIKRF